MQHLIEVRTVGERGPAYLRFSSAPVVDSEPTADEDDVVIDRAADGSVVGIELISIVPETVVALAAAAKQLNLDLSLLFTRSLDAHAA